MLTRFVGGMSTDLDLKGQGTRNCGVLCAAVWSGLCGSGPQSPGQDSTGEGLRVRANWGEKDLLTDMGYRKGESKWHCILVRGGVRKGIYGLCGQAAPSQNSTQQCSAATRI